MWRHQESRSSIISCIISSLPAPSQTGLKNEAGCADTENGNVVVEQLLKADRFIEPLTEFKISRRYEWAREFIARGNAHCSMMRPKLHSGTSCRQGIRRLQEAKKTPRGT